MRRSCAPSMKRSLPAEPAPTKYRQQQPLPEAASPDPGMLELLASSENHVRVLEARAAVRKPAPATAVRRSPSPPTQQQQVKFRVCWGKITTKKHKTWEGDGTLTVGGRSATLRDEDGKVIGSSGSVKVEELDEGARLIVGSKEVELVERIDGEGREVVRENAGPVKRVKVEARGGFKPPAESMCAGRPIVVTSFKQVGPVEEEIADDFVPLTMREPSFEHQWKYNKSKAAVTPVSVPYCVAKHLRPHQREGVSFLYECVLGMKREDSEQFGAILADEMGLGKTLQTLALIYTLMKQGPYGQQIVKRVLIVTPSSLVDNWDREITKWLKQERVFTFIVGPNNKLKKYAQSAHIPILIISYELLAKQVGELETVKFDLVVCDEGHRLKNSNIKIAEVLDGIDCRRRILLTGTPIQNDLQEFHSLINFVNPGLLGTYQEFKAKYETPIVQSQQPNVLPQFQELGQTRLNELNSITSSFILRRTQEVNNSYLPEKQELVIFAHPSELQEKLLTLALKHYEQSGTSAVTPLQLITILKKICNHPSLISTTDSKEPDSLQNLLIAQLPSWQHMGPADSGKLAILESLLEALIERREKVVIVSYFSKTLDMIAGLCEHFNYKFCRLDGATPSHDRGKLVAAFNNPSSDIFIFLLSAKAGGIGLNLVGASRLVLFDNDWNPASDLQAMSRIWRDGQTRKVFIYRLITAFSIEEKIFQRQISKTSLSGTVVDQKQNLNNLKLSDDELKDLFSPVEDDDREDCLTHQILACECTGSGDVPQPAEAASSQEEVESPERSRYRIKLGKPKKKQKHSLKMQELMRWQHHRAPVRQQVLEELSLQSCLEDIVFLFRNVVNRNKKLN
uniref:DNA repair and recombination protein RAD54-like n=1 Tax=Culex tarsalis TaxID=7177 RepID=A0A1Q3EZ06_CULTA